MPHKIIMKVHGVESPSVQVPLELYVVSYTHSALKLCTGTCCVVSSIIVLFLLQLSLGSCRGSRLAGFGLHPHQLLGGSIGPKNHKSHEKKLDTSYLGAVRYQHLLL